MVEQVRVGGAGGLNRAREASDVHGILERHQSLANSGEAAVILPTPPGRAATWSCCLGGTRTRGQLLPSLHSLLLGLLLQLETTHACAAGRVHAIDCQRVVVSFGGLAEHLVAHWLRGAHGKLCPVVKQIKHIFVIYLDRRRVHRLHVRHRHERED